MDDLSAKISQILSDPQALQQIKGLGEQLGFPSTLNEPKKEEQKVIEQSPIGNGFSPDMLSMLSKLAPMMSNMNSEDDTTRLLKALRPFLSEERKRKLDEASKLIKMLKLLPLIKDFGILDTLL
ncbi:MAG: hypothetical protein IJ275_05485 [Ruminococcus sp.]|nr:hypothetical protein [Ruminococcus sp.]